jgi:hypothetical protein
MYSLENDPFWNLKGVIYDMEATGEVDHVTIRTCKRVAEQITEMQKYIKKLEKLNSNNITESN